MRGAASTATRATHESADRQGAHDSAIASRGTGNCGWMRPMIAVLGLMLFAVGCGSSSPAGTGGAGESGAGTAGAAGTTGHAGSIAAAAGSAGAAGLAGVA